MTTEPANDDYVTQAAWHAPAARPDAIDEVADQFERPAAAGAQQFWAPGEAGWPQAPRPWNAANTRPHLGIAS
jgi:hypothetical protein